MMFELYAITGNCALGYNERAEEEAHKQQQRHGRRPSMHGRAATVHVATLGRAGGLIVENPERTHFYLFMPSKLQSDKQPANPP